jgi:hypothetical protein
VGRIAGGILACGAALVISGGAWAQSLAGLSNQDAVAGLKDALVQAAGKTVSQLGATNGFLGNPQVRIPLPGPLERASGLMRTMGMGRQAEELQTSMNRAAEMAVKEATPLLVNAVKGMSVQDAKGILTGGEDAATQYFRRTTSAPLEQKFLPIVKQMTAKVQLAEQYNALAGQAAQFGLIDAKSANLDSYVTQKALDGLFTVMAEQERTIRKDPLGAATGMASKVFGMLK